MGAFTTLLEGPVMKDLLGQASGVPLDGPVVMQLAWRRPGDHERLNYTGTDFTRDQKQIRARIGFRLELHKAWSCEYGGEILWADPLYALAPAFNQLTIFPAGPALAMQRVMEVDESSSKHDAKKLLDSKHLVLEGWYTTSKMYDAKMLEKGYN